jgi:N4-gp56 family major capsid protein
MQGRDSQTPAFTDVIATVSKYGEFFIVNEEVDLYNPNGTTDELVAILAEQAGRSLNMLMRNIAEDDTTQRYAENSSVVTAVHTKITSAELNRAINELTRNSARVFGPMTNGSTNIGTAPILPSYWAFTHPDVAVDVAGITGFKSVETYAGQVATLDGEFGYYPLAGRGVRFVMSEDASIDPNAGADTSGEDVRSTSAQADIYSTVIVGQNALGSVGLGMRHTDGSYRAGENRDAFQLIFHPAGSGGTSDPFDEIGTLAYKAFFSGAVLNANWARSIRTGATNLEN